MACEALSLLQRPSRGVAREKIRSRKYPEYNKYPKKWHCALLRINLVCFIWNNLIVVDIAKLIQRY